MSIDLSLTRLLQLLPHLPYTRPTLHIAGTNGKGSVSALLTSILLATPTSPSHPAPLRIGRFNSPHLLSVLDSITLSNVPVLDADRAQGTKLTNFEVLTMAALRVFENEKVDIVVLEVGMGGRLDATNVIPDESVLVSALTAVDLDHQMFLGATVGLIAKEKAGIARKGRSFVLGRQSHAEVKEVVKAAVESVGGTLVPALEVKPGEGAVRWSILELNPDSADVTPPPQPVVVTLKSFPDTPLRASLPLHGAHQLDNLGTALGVIDSLLSSSLPLATALNLKGRISLDSIAQGIAATRWPGRLSFHTLSVPLQDGHQKKLVVLADGAHNPASAETLGAYITHLLSLSQSSTSSPLTTTVPITYILALSHSPPKTPLQTLSPILPPTLPHPPPPLPLLLPLHGMPWIKSVPPTELKAVVQSLVPHLGEGGDVWVASEDISSLEDALKREGMVVLAGSLYLVADFYRLLERGL
ncbi:Mur ligase [Gymnopilus junonius]|uniref:Mur ligase n=1 Tax=Gymnopilus junonius TaxID=109634 RepID=A0A9P5NKV0_GYMJU|nr:Mur ligase [Gymnopilus junonius]